MRCLWVSLMKLIEHGERSYKTGVDEIRKLQTRGAFVRDRNSWRESRLKVTNKYLELENLEKGDSGVKRTRRFKFPHRTLKGKVRCSLTVPTIE